MLSAAVPLRLNSSRSVFLAGNARIVTDCLRPLYEAGDAFRGVVLMPADPVDPLQTWTHRQSRLPRPGRTSTWTFEVAASGLSVDPVARSLRHDSTRPAPCPPQVTEEPLP